MTITIKFNHEKFAQLSPAEYWRIIIDGNQQTDLEELGWYRYEKRESGSVKSLLRAYAYMLDTLGQPLSVQLIQKLHEIALGTANFQNRCFQVMRAGQFRKRDLTFGLYKGANWSEKGFKRFQQGLPHEVQFNLHGKKKIYGYAFFDPSLPYGIFEPKANPADLPRCVQSIISQYEQDLTEAKKHQGNSDAILLIIATCVNDLELQHPFDDGNGRVFCTLVLQKLLLENGFDPCILTDPNRFDGYTPEELVEEIKSGFSNFRLLHSLKPTTADILRLQLEKDASSFHLAISMGVHLWVTTMLPLVKNINAVDEFGKSPLMIASVFADIETIDTLLQRADIDINQEDQFGCTAAMWAEKYGRMDIALRLRQDPRSNKSDHLNADPMMIDSMTLAKFIENFKKIDPKTLHFSKQDLSYEDDELLTGIEFLFQRKTVETLSMSELIFLYGALKQLTVPIIVREDLLTDLKQLINNAQPSILKNKIILTNDYDSKSQPLKLIKREALLDLPGFPQMEKIFFNDHSWYDESDRWFAYFANNITNINDLLACLPLTRNKKHFVKTNINLIKNSQELSTVIQVLLGLSENIGYKYLDNIDVEETKRLLFLANEDINLNLPFIASHHLIAELSRNKIQLSLQQINFVSAVCRYGIDVRLQNMIIGQGENFLSLMGDKAILPSDFAQIPSSLTHEVAINLQNLLESPTKFGRHALAELRDCGFQFVDLYNCKFVWTVHRLLERSGLVKDYLESKPASERAKCINALLCHDQQYVIQETDLLQTQISNKQMRC